MAGIRLHVGAQDGHAIYCGVGIAVRERLGVIIQPLGNSYLAHTKSSVASTVNTVRSRKPPSRLILVARDRVVEMTKVPSIDGVRKTYSRKINRSHAETFW